ncbi:MAG: hypothetical protein MZV70_73465 [Desulfobacterales bacterium]|nr:hypothetical protein [Desulfobacterales bacterium]
MIFGIPSGRLEGPLPDHRDAGRPVHHRIHPGALGQPHQGDHGHHAARAPACLD